METTRPPPCPLSSPSALALWSLGSLGEVLGVKPVVQVVPGVERESRGKDRVKGGGVTGGEEGQASQGLEGVERCGEEEGCLGERQASEVGA